MRGGDYVVVQFNQASGQPSLYDTEVFDNLADAEDTAKRARKFTADVGRRERYRVYELTEIEEDKS